MGCFALGVPPLGGPSFKEERPPEGGTPNTPVRSSVGREAPSCLDLVPALAQFLDHEPLQFARDRLAELPANVHAFLRNDRHLVEKFLPDRLAIERRDLAHLINREVA